jgi:hypothetical protein
MERENTTNYAASSVTVYRNACDPEKAAPLGSNVLESAKPSRQDYRTDNAGTENLAGQ